MTDYFRDPHVVSLRYRIEPSACRAGVAGRVVVGSWLHGHGRCAGGGGRRARMTPRRTEHAGASRLFMHPSS